MSPRERQTEGLLIELTSDFLLLQLKTLGLSGILKTEGLEIRSVLAHRVLSQETGFSTEDSGRR